MSWREYGFLAAVDAWTEVTQCGVCPALGMEPDNPRRSSSYDGSAARHAGRRSLDGRGG